jgi:hypothetical protein
MVLVGLAACHDPAATAPSDAPTVDAAPERYCPGLSQLTFAAATAQDVASDGATLYVSTGALDGTTQLQALSLAGGSPTTVVSAAQGQITLAAFADAVFYAAPTSATTYDLHQRVAENDTPLGSITSSTPPLLAANATDLYVLATDASATTLWRAARSGGGAPSQVASVAGTAVSSSLAIGTTHAAWTGQYGVRIAAIPGPGPVTTASVLPSGGVAFTGDIGVVLTATMQTSHLYTLLAMEVTPGMQVLTSQQTTSGWWTGLLADDRYFYYTTSDADGDVLVASNLDWTGGSGRCTLASKTTVRQGAAHLYQLVQVGSGQWRIDVIPKP